MGSLKFINTGWTQPSRSFIGPEKTSYKDFFKANYFSYYDVILNFNYISYFFTKI